MANLIVTFGRATARKHGLPAATGVQAFAGSNVRSELIPISSGSEPGQLTADNTDDVVMIRAEAACWVTVGIGPVAVKPVMDSDGSDFADAHYFAANQEKPLLVSLGEGVAVIAA